MAAGYAAPQKSTKPMLRMFHDMGKRVCPRSRLFALVIQQSVIRRHTKHVRLDGADFELARVHGEAPRAPALLHLALELDQDALVGEPGETVVLVPLRRLGLDAVFPRWAAAYGF